jgi:crotonobetainyl-CoA:carnitine CoA-transferase CaiB-like acyl-CoA transferase
MQSALDLQAESLVAWLNAPTKPAAIHAHAHVAGWHYAAPYGVYATSDGHLALSLSPLSVLAEVLDEPKLKDYPDEDSWRRQDEISELIARRLETATTGHWVARMERLKIWHAPVRDYAEIAADPQVEHMSSLLTVAGAGDTRSQVTLVNHPVLYDRKAAEVRLPPQPLGAQTRELLMEIGLDPAEITALAEEQVIKLGP